MTTIEIIQEPTNSTAAYRAICRDWQAVGNTPGEALDAVERMAATDSENGNGTLVIVQHFRPDVFFTRAQQEKLRTLMERFHAAQALGQELPAIEKRELEQLVNAEWQAAIQRAAAIMQAAHPAKAQAA